MFMEKNEGCLTMMCGTDAHGNVEKAMSNGGCAHEFEWNTMAALKNGCKGNPLNDRQKNFFPPSWGGVHNSGYAYVPGSTINPFEVIH